MSTPNGQPPTRLPVKTTHLAARPFSRGADWTVGAIAAILVLISVGGYIHHRKQISALAAEHLRLVVTGPSNLLSGFPAKYLVSTTAINGQPMTSQIEVALLDSAGNRLKTYKEATDENGQLEVLIPTELSLPPQITLKVSARCGENVQQAEIPLRAEPSRHITRLQLDKAQYQPGDVLHYRLVALSRPSLNPVQGAPIRFQIFDSSGAAVPGAQNDVATQRGIGHGDFTIPESAAPGQYAIVASSLDDAFSPQKKPFSVVGKDTAAEAAATTNPPLDDSSGSASQPAPKDDIQPNSSLAEAAGEQMLTVSTGAGVFDSDQPLELTIRSYQAGLPLVVEACSDGVQVGEKPLVTSASSPVNPVVVPLDKQVSGLLGLAVFDYSASPPKKVAESLVYRRPTLRLNIQASGLQETYSPGESVAIELLATNEKGEPMPTVLGAIVLEMAPPPSPPDATAAKASQKSLPDLLALAGVSGPVVFELSDRRKEPPPSPPAIDFMLATRDGNCAAHCCPPPAMSDNMQHIRGDYQSSLDDYKSGRTEMLETLIIASFFGGLGLVILVGMLGLLRIAAGMHLWIPAVGAVTCCLIVGSILLDPGRLANGHGAVSFCSYHAPAELPEESELKNKSPAVPSAPAARAEKTIYWNPAILTDADGKATIRFDLPATPGIFHLIVDAYAEERFGAECLRIESRPKPD